MKLRLLITFGILIVLVYAYNNYFTIQMVEGIYVNKNYEDSNGGANFPDTLSLYENHRFESNYWGTGHYKLSYSWRGTRIALLSNNSLITKVYRSWFSKPRIMVMRDFNNYYEKQ